MAAVGARASRSIDNAAREPEIADLAAFLVAMGARIDGAGSRDDRGAGGARPSRPARAHGRSPIGSRPGRSPSRRWRRGATSILEDARSDHLELVFDKLTEAGADVAVTEHGLRVRQDGRPRGVDFVTLPYPGVRDRLAAADDGDARRRGRHQHRDRERVREPVHASSTSSSAWARTCAPRAITR